MGDFPLLCLIAGGYLSRIVWEHLRLNTLYFRTGVRLRFSLESICWYLIGNSSNKDIFFWGGSGGYLKNQPLEIRGYCRGVIHPNRWSPSSHGMDAWWSWTPSTYPSTSTGMIHEPGKCQGFPFFFHPWWTPRIPPCTDFWVWIPFNNRSIAPPQKRKVKSHLNSGNILFYRFEDDYSDYIIDYTGEII